MISDLIYLNSIVASELLSITENLAALRHGEEFLQKSSCISEHTLLKQEIINIVKSYCKEEKNSSRLENLNNHVLKHQ